MSGDHYLADTNTFIALLNKHPAIKSFIESNWYFSFITEIELLGKPQIKPSELKNIQDLLGVCTKLIHAESINQITIKLKQTNKIKLPDALVAATAIHYDLPLLTFDRDFSRINGLELILLE